MNPTALAESPTPPPRISPVPTPRRILFLGHTAVLGGAELAMLRLIRALDPARYQPLVLLFSEGPLVWALRQAGVETHVLPADPRLVKTDRHSLARGLFSKTGALFRSLFFIRRLAKRIRQLRPDIVHTNTLKADVLGSFANLFARKPLVWYVHDRIADDYMPRRAVRTMRFLAHHMPDFLLANSRSSMENVADDRTDRCAIAYPGVDREAFCLPLNVSKNPRPVVGLVGRISPTKGQDIFLQAAALVLETMPQVQFRIIGAALFNEAQYESMLREMALQLKLGDSVEFQGFSDNVPAAIAQLDLLVHASTVAEPFGQVVVEGMAAAKPVVATRAGGIPEVVLDGQTGLLVPPGNAQAMAAAITQILSNPASAAAMAAAGRIRAQQLFTIEQTAQAVMSAYDAVLHDAP